ncbi:MAG: TonB-dependent receptor plug domain-containing protein [Saprospiraceae bacterium]
MKTFKLFSISFLALFAFALISCGGAKKTTAIDMSGEGSVNVYDADAEAKKSAAKAQTTSQAEVEVNNGNLTLADYLRRIPGVQVRGSGTNASVTVRGGGSMGGSNSPLYVIDGSQVGNDYGGVASQVDPNDIKSVRVLKDASATSAYGMQGSSGVIVIKTKSAAEARKKRKRN